MKTYIEELKELNKKWNVPDNKNEHWILRDRIILDIGQYEKQNDVVEKLKEQTFEICEG
jgi:hypothetical protein